MHWHNSGQVGFCLIATQMCAAQNQEVVPAWRMWYVHESNRLCTALQLQAAMRSA